MKFGRHLPTKILHVRMALYCITSMEISAHISDPCNSHFEPPLQLTRFLLPLQQLTSKLEPLTALRPLPGKQLVENYIKAFYLPEAALKDWLKQHNSFYTQKQLLSLVGVMSHIPKHSRTSFIHHITSESYT